MKLLRRAYGLLLAILLVLGLALPALADAPTIPATILFTHDMHSHFLPATDESGQEYGGYARLKTAIDAQKAVHPAAILVDGGDLPLASVRLTAPVPKGRIFDVMEKIRQVRRKAPVNEGDVVIADVLGLGVDVIVTRTVEKA